MTPALDFTSCIANGWTLTPDIGVRAIAVGGLLGMAGWVSAQPFFPGRGAFVAMVGAISWWLTAATLERAAGGAECKSAIALIEWPAIAAVPMVWLLFVLQYVRSDHRAPSPPWWLANGLPLLAVSVLVLANGSHGWFYGPATRGGEPVLGTPRMVYDRGPLFWAVVAWGYTLLAASFVMLVRALIAAPGGQRSQWRGLLAIAAFPVAVNLAYLFLGLRLGGSDPTPISFAVAAIGLAWLIQHRRLFDVIPMARRLLLTELADPVLVLDRELRVMDANVAARQLSVTVPPPASPLGAWPRFGVLLEHHLRSGDRGLLALIEPTAHYEVHVREIGEGERRIGMLVQLHDVTAREEAARAEAEAQARAASAAPPAGEPQPAEDAALQAFLREQAMRDPLTGLLNRRALEERFVQEAGYAIANGQVLSLGVLDVDHFKRINDGHGHGAGDSVLRDFSAALRTGLRTSDSVFRIAGGAFAILLPGADAAQAARRLQALRERVSGRKLGGLSEPVTFSAGVSSTEDHGQTLEELMAAADKALHQAKGQGRNRTVVAPVADVLP